MGNLTGSSTAEIDAPMSASGSWSRTSRRRPGWQGGLKGLHAIERDGEGRAVLCGTESDGKVRTLKSIVRFSYDGPTELRWTQEKGDMKSVLGSWKLEDLGSDRTRATYALDVDLGRMLGMVIRGPLVDMLRDMLVKARAGELKKHVEA